MRLSVLPILIACLFYSLSFAQPNLRSAVSKHGPRTAKGAFTTGGVFGVSEITFYFGDKIVAPEEISFGNHKKDKNELCILYKGDCYWIVMNTDRLSLLTQLVENKAVGLFTAYGDYIESLPVEEREGYIKCETFGDEDSFYCASELAGTSLEESLFYLDFTAQPPLSLFFISPEPRAAGWIGEYDATLPDRAHWKDPVPRDWEISDLNSFFRANLADGEVELSGDVYAYHRSLIEIKSASISDTEKNKVSRNDIEFLGGKNYFKHTKFTKIDKVNLEHENFLMENEEFSSIAENVENGVKLLQQIAFFRTIKNHNPSEWENLLKIEVSD